ncbi:MAG: hypothetical protein LBR80_07685 [Deltaproteobacteria bacterium]|jgi:sec-independent protein translocase protein TatB|nr:hypothetical protein [Deltaproteobacteria bacterium]
MAPGLGYTEIAFIILVALILVKPKDLPGVLRSVAKFYREARRVLWGMRDSLLKELDEIKNLDGIKELRDMKDMEEIRDLKGIGDLGDLKDPLGLSPGSDEAGMATGDAGKLSGHERTPMEDIYPELGKVAAQGEPSVARVVGASGISGERAGESVEGMADRAEGTEDRAEADVRNGGEGRESLGKGGNGGT